MDIEKVFNAIKSFVTEINSLYGAHYKPLALYGRLIEKTNLSHTIPVNKHINAFRKFMVSNRNAIYNMNEQEFKPHKIQYNDNVYFNIKTIMNMADPDTQQVIWQHLLVLSALLDSGSNAKQRIKEHQLALSEQEATSNPGLDPMLSGIMNMVSSVMMSDGGSGGEGVGNTSGLGDMGNVFGQIMSSGILPKMMTTISSSVKDGQLDIGNIVSSVQSLAKECNLDLPPIEENDEQVDKMLDMFGGLGLDKSKMKEMVNVFQQHVTVDKDDEGHVHTEKDTTLVQIPVETHHTNESTTDVQQIESTTDVQQIESTTDVQQIESTTELESTNINEETDKDDETSQTVPEYECKDGVCYLK
jgi:hypothetical protein